MIGTLRPSAIHSSLLARWNLPVGLKSAEVIEANDVALLQCPLHALNPPVISALAEYVPAVKRIAPALSGAAKKIGRHARNIDRVAVFVELKDLGMVPDVGAIQIDEDGDVGDELDAICCAVLMHRAPLFKKEELNRARNHQLALVLLFYFLYGTRVAPPQFVRPVHPALLAMMVAHDFV